MLEIDALSKTAVYDVMKELLYTINYMYSKLEDLLRKRHLEVYLTDIENQHNNVGKQQ